jgi:hypothetical protein
MGMGVSVGSGVAVDSGESAEVVVSVKADVEDVEAPLAGCPLDALTAAVAERDDGVTSAVIAMTPNATIATAIPSDSPIIFTSHRRELRAVSDA